MPEDRTGPPVEDEHRSSAAEWMSTSRPANSPGVTEMSPGAQGFSNRYATLDGLRGFAAAAVVMLHGGGLFTPLRIANAGFAVDFFFALSGFVILHAYDRRLRTGMTLREFTVTRLVRFYPLYLAGTLVGLGVAILARPSAGLIWEAIPAALMLPSPSPYHLYPLNAVAWSLGFEMLINVVYAATWRYWTVTALIIVSGIAWIWLAADAKLTGGADGGWTWQNVLGGFPRVIFSFVVGAIIYKTLDKLPRIPTHPVLLAAALIAALAVPGGWAYQLFCVTAIFPLILLSGAQTSAGRLEPVMLWLGAVSYAAYAIHKPLLSFVTNAAEDGLHVNLADYAPISGVLFLLAFLAGCSLLDRIYDTPLRALLMKRLAVRDRMSPQTVP